MLKDLKEVVTGVSDKIYTINGNIGTLKTNQVGIRKLNTWLYEYKTSLDICKNKKKNNNNRNNSTKDLENGSVKTTPMGEKKYKCI